jgi:SAM-dependent methyltransferase
MNAMSFAEGSFGKVYSINTVYFWEDLEDTLTKIWNILEPGGIFINTLYSNEFLAHLSHTDFGYRKYTVKQLEDAGRETGFEVDAVPILGGKAYCFLYRKKD